MMDVVSLFVFAEKFVRDKGYGWEIDWCDKRPSFDTVDAQRFLSEFAWVVYNSGMKNSVIESKWAGLTKAYEDFDADMIVRSESKVRSSVLGIFGNRRKLDSVIRVAKMVHYYGYELMKLRIKKDPLNYLVSLPYIGDITKHHLARNLGFDHVKPDRHLVRLADKYGMTPFQLCQQIHEVTNRRIGAIDVILWRFMEQKGLEEIEE